MREAPALGIAEVADVVVAVFGHELGVHVVVAGAGHLVVYSKSVPESSLKRLLCAGLMVVAPELWYLDTYSLPTACTVSYLSYYPGPGFLSAVVKLTTIYDYKI